MTPTAQAARFAGDLTTDFAIVSLDFFRQHELMLGLPTHFAPGVRAQKSRGDHRTDFERGVHDFRRASPLRLETPAQANYNGKIEPYKGAGSKGERRTL